MGLFKNILVKKHTRGGSTVKSHVRKSTILKHAAKAVARAHEGGRMKGGTEFLKRRDKISAIASKHHGEAFAGHVRDLMDSHVTRTAKGPKSAAEKDYTHMMRHLHPEHYTGSGGKKMPSLKRKTKR